MKLIKLITISSLILMLTGCGSSAESVESVLNRLEFGDDETGCIRMSSDLKLGGNPFVGSDTRLVYQKRKGENAPDC